MARRGDLLVQDFDDETLVYDLVDDRGSCLNETAASVWSHCDGTNDIDAIAALVSNDLQAPVTAPVVEFALGQLRDAELLQNPEVVSADDGAMSRRAAIRRIGLASAVAIPTVATLAVPSAVAAQSCLPLHDPCDLNMPDACCSGNCIQNAAPASCCAQGVVTNRPTGSTHICLPVAVAAQPNCNGDAAVACCSGTSTLANAQGTDGCPNGFVACVCD